jgi:hypothetical protein
MCGSFLSSMTSMLVLGLYFISSIVSFNHSNDLKISEIIQHYFFNRTAIDFMTTFLERYDLREESTDSYTQREKLLRWILSALRQVVLTKHFSLKKKVLILTQKVCSFLGI